LDKNWEWGAIFPFPSNFIVAFFCFGIGGFIVWYSYGYLFIKGDGSPGSHLGHTQYLVKTGIYSWVRHPSNIGKLIGVIGLGILMQTPGFIFVIVPALFLYSLVTTLTIQEHFCIKNFGQEYLDYKKEVPMFIPKISRITKALTSRKDK
jgi:protein-S-isoprenylcysteine O-methyltransferase Ste14